MSQNLSKSLNSCRLKLKLQTHKTQKTAPGYYPPSANDDERSSSSLHVCRPPPPQYMYGQPAPLEWWWWRTSPPQYMYGQPPPMMMRPPFRQQPQQAPPPQQQQVTSTTESSSTKVSPPPSDPSPPPSREIRHNNGHNSRDTNTPSKVVTLPSFENFTADPLAVYIETYPRDRTESVSYDRIAVVVWPSGINWIVRPESHEDSDL